MNINKIQKLEIMKNVKNISAYLTLLLLALFMLSCSKDDDNTEVSEPTNQELILGQWFWESFSTGSELSACEKRSSMLFLEDGTLIHSLYSADFSGECSLSDNLESNYSFITDDLIRGEYSESTTFSLTIVSISKNELVISFDEGGGSTILTLKKQES